MSSGYTTASESGLDPLPDYDEDETGVGSIPSGTLAVRVVRPAYLWDTRGIV